MAYLITRVRTVFADDGEHLHLDLVGYESAHTPGEPIMVPVSRIVQQIAFGESYAVTVDGEPVEVQVGKCPLCGHEPHLKTAKDSATRAPLFELERI